MTASAAFLRRLARWSVPIVSAAALACGSHSGGQPPVDPVVQGGGAPGTAPCGGHVTLRLQGVNGSPFDAFHLGVGKLDVRVSGATAPVESALSGSLDLLAPGAWRLGVVALPPVGTMLDASLPISGGDAHALAGDAGAFDGCTAPFTFRVDPAQVDPVRCHAVLHVDLARSAPLLASGAGLVLAPNFSLHY